MPAFASASAPKTNPFDSSQTAPAPAPSTDDPRAPAPGAEFSPPAGDPGAQAGALDHYADPAPADSPGTLSKAWTAAKDGASLLSELIGFAGFHILSGIFEGDLDIGKAAYYCQKIHPGGVLGMFALDPTTRGSDMVHVKIDVYNETFELSAGTLSVTGVDAGGFASGPLRLNGLHASGTRSSADVSIGSAAATAPRFTTGGSTVAATDVGLGNPHFEGATTGSSLYAAMRFDEAHVDGLAYPGLPPTNIDLADAGMSFVKLTTAVAPMMPAKPGATAAPAEAGGLPSAGGLLPTGSHIDLDLSGIHAAAAMTDGKVEGSGGFDHFHVKLVGADGKDLASVGIDGFHAAAAGNAAAGRIDQLTVMGAPGLVESLLNNPEARALPHVADALALLANHKLQPAAGVNLSLSGVSASTATDGKGETKASGNIATAIAIPDVGSLSLDVRGCAVDIDQAAAAGSFDQLTLKLDDANGKEVGYLELDGASGKESADGKTDGGALKHVTVRGDAAGLIRAAETHLTGESKAIHGALAAVKAMGLSGNVSADVKGDLDGGKLALAGDLDFKFEAPGDKAEVTLHLAGAKGGENASAMTASFKKLEARLMQNGKEAAYLGADGVSEADAKKGTSGVLSAGKIEVRGDTARVADLLETITKQAGSMPPAVKGAVDLVKAQGLAASGDITLTQVSAQLDGKGDAHMKGNLAAKVALAGVGEVTIGLSGIAESVDPKKGEITTFDHLDISAADVNGGQAADISVSGGSVGVGSAGVAVDVQALEIRGDHAKAGAILDGLAQNFTVIPAPARAVLSQLAGMKLGGTGQIDLANVHVDADGKGSAKASGDVHLVFDVAGAGKVALDVMGFNGDLGPDAGGLAFQSFSATLSDAGGGQAAHIGVVGGAAKEGGADAGVHADQVFAQGSAEHIASLLSGIEAQIPTMPPEVAKALAAVQQHSAEIKADAAVSLSDVNFTPGATPTAKVRDLDVRGGLVLGDAAGGSYSCPDAIIDIGGAQVQLGPNGTPQRIDAASLKASGDFSIPGKSGHATLSTGAVTIIVGADGSLQTVTGAGIQASGELTSGSAPKPAAADPAAKPTAPTGPAPPADPHATENMAAAAAGMVESADIHTVTPLLAGRYGKGFVHLGVPANAALHIDLAVRNNAITQARVAAQPALDLPLGISATGAHVDNKGGGNGEIKTDTSGFIDFVVGLFDIPDRILTGQKNIPLDLTKLVHSTMSHLDLGGGGGGASEPAAAPAPTANNEADAWMKSAHGEWAADVAEHQADAPHESAAKQKKVAAQDAEAEPRSADIGGIATSGVEYMETTGSADLELATGAHGTNVAGVELGAGNQVHLKGQAAGGQVELQADANVSVAGQHLTVTGLDTGKVTPPADGHLAFSSFKIAEIQWNNTGGGDPPK